jgi:small subunit ribosomal protein S1
MAELMKSVKSSFISPKKGEALEGTITKLTSYEVLVDIGAKTEAVVLEKDKRLLKNIIAGLKVGDKVSVSVLNPESESGNPVVSLRRFMDDKVWEKLNELQKSQSIIDGTITEITRGGFIVVAEDAQGFLPNSQASFLETGQNPLSKKVKVTVLELNREQHKIIFSQKLGQSIDFEKEIEGLASGQKINSTISNVASFGIFITLQGKTHLIEGLIHISEISWEKISEVPKNFKSGEEIEAIIIGFDKKSARVNLSLRRLTEDPFEKEIARFEEDKKITAPVSQITGNGILFDLGTGIEGIVKKEKVPPNVVYKEGQAVSLTVSSVDKKRRLVILTPVLMEKPIGYR